MAIVLLSLAMGASDAPSTAQATALGRASGRLLVYFHFAQSDVRAQRAVPPNPFCRRQISEEIAGFKYDTRYPVTTSEHPPSNPDDWGKPGASRQTFHEDTYQTGDPNSVYHYRGRYEIGGLVFDNTDPSDTTLQARTALTAELRVIAYMGPPGSFTAAECQIAGPSAIVDAKVTGNYKNMSLSCFYPHGTAGRVGLNITEDLRGSCTITNNQTGATRTAPTHEVRTLVAENQGGDMTDCDRGHKSPDPQRPPPGTWFIGPGDCFYLIDTVVEADS